MSDLTDAFADGPALVAYVVAGDPGPGEDHSDAGIEETKAHVRALVEGGADVVELGLPFSEPIAEGKPIQEGIERALAAGMTPDRYLDLVADLDVDVPVVCMTYYNLLFQFGAREARSVVRESEALSSSRETPGVSRTTSERASGPEAREQKGPEEFVAAAADAGVAGLVVPDLPVEESEPLRAACEVFGVDLVSIVAPTTTEERRERILDTCSGFVYVQSRLGTTGERDDVSDQTYESLDRIGDTDLPKAVGFGVSRGEHARAIVAGGADGVVAGSVFVEAVASGEDVPAKLVAIARELADGMAQAVPQPERT
jgi:tryptophan synthase alpha chain